MSRALLEAQLAALQKELDVRQRERAPGVHVPPTITPHVLGEPNTKAPPGRAEARKALLQAHAAQAPGTPTQEREAPSIAEAQAPMLDRQLQKVLVPRRSCLHITMSGLCVYSRRWADRHEVSKPKPWQALKATGNALLKAGKHAAAASAYSKAVVLAEAAAADATLQSLLFSNRSHARWCCGAFTKVATYTKRLAVPPVTYLEPFTSPYLQHSCYSLRRQPRMQRRPLHWRPPGPSRSTGWHRRALEAHSLSNAAHCQKPMASHMLLSCRTGHLATNPPLVLSAWHWAEASFQDRMPGSAHQEIKQPARLLYSCRACLKVHSYQGQSQVLACYGMLCSCRPGRAWVSGVRQSTPRGAARS